jgi:hypothetical protein
MAAPKNQNRGPALSALVRQAGQKAKVTVEQVNAPDDVTGGPKKANIFNVLDYIEQPWGLGMRLYPVQRAIVKLYYHIPLETKTKTTVTRETKKVKQIRPSEVQWTDDGDLTEETEKELLLAVF